MRVGRPRALSVGLAALLISWAGAAAPAQAKVAKVATHVTAHITPATAYVGSRVVVSGSVTPRVAKIELERLVGKAWKPVAHAGTSKTGSYSLSLTMPRTAAISTLRVVAGKTSSGTLSVRVTKAVYKVTAKPTATTINSGGAVTFTGVVSPKATGSVWLQELRTHIWHNVASAKLASHSTYTVAAHLPAGPHRLRVVKAFSARIAGGVAVAATVTVLTSPVVTTTTLPGGTAGHGYSATLTTVLGLGPYTWSVVAGALPAGLSLSPGGVISGVPLTKGTATVTFRATDSHGQTADATLTLTVAPAYGVLWSWGQNSSGQLGNASMAGTDTIVAVSNLKTVTAVAASYETAYALQSDGTVWAWGENFYGGLGDDTTNDSSIPIQVHNLSGVVGVAAGQFDGYALKSDGTLWAWGINGLGEVGDGSVVDRHLPTQVQGLSNVTAVAAGADFAMALEADGSVWTWGYNAFGQLGDGSTNDSHVPVKVGLLPAATAIAAGYNGGYAALTDGRIESWGDNGEDQLGNGSSTPQSAVPVVVSGLNGVAQLASQGFTAYALRTDGSVWSWGYGGDGQLGNNSTADAGVPVQVSGLTGATAIAAASFTGFAVLADGTVRAWGSNQYGDLGDGSSAATSALPVQVSALVGVTGIAAGDHFGVALQTG